MTLPVPIDRNRGILRKLPNGEISLKPQKNKKVPRNLPFTFGYIYHWNAIVLPYL